MRTVLFLCTGNYYRSRFAEFLFNALASAHGLPWRACSAGLALTADNVGPISAYVLQALRQLGLDPAEAPRDPIAVQEQHLQHADLIVALQEAEHKPYLQAGYPGWVDRVEYWDVRDGVPAAAYDPLQVTEAAVRRLIRRLAV